MELDTAIAYARDRSQSVLVTIRDDTRPQLSNVVHHVGDDGIVRISITTGRAKYVNLTKRPWAALHVTAADFWSYVVIEGDVELSEPAAATDDATVAELVEYYRAVSGEHPDWAEYRRVMVEEGRVVCRVRATRAYGMLPRP